MSFDRREFGEDLVYRTTAPISAIPSDLAKLRGLDERGELLETVYAVLMGVAFFGLTGGIVLLVLSTGTLPCGVVLFIALVGVMSKVGDRGARGNFDDARYGLLAKLVTLLRTDVAPGELTNVHLDLEDLYVERKKIQDAQRVGKYTFTRYRDRWLRVRSRFLDGTRFQLVVDEQVASAIHFKGKKVKRTSTTSLGLQLRPKTKRYPIQQLEFRTVRQAIQVPPGVSIKKVELRSDRVGLAVKIKTKVSGGTVSGPAVDLAETVSRMFLSLYQVLHLARRKQRVGERTRARQPDPGSVSTELVLLLGSGSLTLTPVQTFENIVLAAYVDGTLDVRESAALTGYGARLGLEPRLLESILQRGASGRITTFNVPNGKGQRLRAFREVVRILRSDADLWTSERELTQLLGRKLGVSSAEVQRALASL